MIGHATVGRKYAGKVKQLITGSTGLDDAEWGVTLFAQRYFSDKSDRVPNALRSRQRAVRGFRRILHRHPTAARRTVPPATTLYVAPSISCDGHSRS